MSRYSLPRRLYGVFAASEAELLAEEIGPVEIHPEKSPNVEIERTCSLWMKHSQLSMIFQGIGSMGPDR
jgi:hypothetical protein